MSKTVRIGIIGSGGIAQGAHIPNYQKLPGVEVAALCDVKTETAKAAAEKFKVSRICADYQELVALKDLDAVSICTPNAFHKEPTLAALKAGKHVLVEKPIGLNAKEALEMCRAAKKARRILAVGHHTRYDPRIETLKALMQDVGRPYYARVQAMRRRGIPHWGVFYSKKLNGGGPLIDIGVHSLFSALYLLDFPRPVAVSGKTLTKFGNRPDVALEDWGRWNWKEYDVEDNAYGFVRFEGDLTMTVETSFVANIPQGYNDLLILGDKGGIRLEPPTLICEHHEMVVNLNPSLPKPPGAHQREIAAFVAALRGEGEVGATGEQALAVMQIIDGIYESSGKGCEVKIEKIRI